MINDNKIDWFSRITLIYNFTFFFSGIKLHDYLIISKSESSSSSSSITIPALLLLLSVVF